MFDIEVGNKFWKFGWKRLNSWKVIRVW